MNDPLNHAKNVDLIEKTTPYQGYFQIDVYRLRHKRFGGGWTEVMSREMFERCRATVVLPYDPARDAVVLIEQFRIGAYAAGLKPWLVEPVAGIVEPGETPEATVPTILNSNEETPGSIGSPSRSKATTRIRPGSSPRFS